MNTKTFDEHGIVIDTPDQHFRKAIFLWKRNPKQNWDDLLNSSLEDLTKRVDEIIAAEKEKAEKSSTKVPNISEIIKMEEFKNWAKTNEKYLDFVSRVGKAKNDPTVGDDEMKKRKAESATLIKELAKEYKKVLAAA